MKTLKIVNNYGDDFEVSLEGWPNDKGAFYMEIHVSGEEDCEKRWISLNKDDAQALIWELQKFINSNLIINAGEGNPNEN